MLKYVGYGAGAALVLYGLLLPFAPWARALQLLGLAMSAAFLLALLGSLRRYPWLKVLGGLFALLAALAVGEFLIQSYGNPPPPLANVLATVADPLHLAMRLVSAAFMLTVAVTSVGLVRIAGAIAGALAIIRVGAIFAQQAGLFSHDGDLSLAAIVDASLGLFMISAAAAATSQSGLTPAGPTRMDSQKL